MNDDFFIGYLPKAPAPIASRARATVALLLAGAALVGVLLVRAQRPFSTSVFEYGARTPLEGRVELEPAPSLVVPHPADGESSRFLLTIFGKRGAADAVRDFDGHRVRLEGALIHHDGQVMFEIQPDTIEDLGAVPPHPNTAPESLGARTLRGEVVDSKCFLGVMKPGSAKLHRACATRCISGGVPPVLLVRDSAGHASYYLLTGTEGEAVNDRILDRIAEPIEITGELVRHGDLLVLASDPDTWRRLP